MILALLQQSVVLKSQEVKPGTQHPYSSLRICQLRSTRWCNHVHLSCNSCTVVSQLAISIPLASEFWVSSFELVHICPLWEAFRKSVPGEYSQYLKELRSHWDYHLKLLFPGYLSQVGFPLSKLNAVNLILRHHQPLCIAWQMRHLHKAAVSTAGARRPELDLTHTQSPFMHVAVNNSCKFTLQRWRDLIFKDVKRASKPLNHTCYSDNELPRKAAPSNH